MPRISMTAKGRHTGMWVGTTDVRCLDSCIFIRREGFWYLNSFSVPLPE